MRFSPDVFCLTDATSKAGLCVCVADDWARSCEVLDTPKAMIPTVAEAQRLPTGQRERHSPSILFVRPKPVPRRLGDRFGALSGTAQRRIVMGRKTASRGQDENASRGEPTQRHHQFKRHVYAWSGGACEQAVEESGDRVKGCVHRDRRDYAEAR